MVIEVVDKSMWDELAYFDGDFQHFQDDCPMNSDDMDIDEADFTNATGGYTAIYHSMRCCGRNLTKSDLRDLYQ